jgi:hypothetical protein
VVFVAAYNILIGILFMKNSIRKTTPRPPRSGAAPEKLPDIPTTLLTHFVLKALQESRASGSALTSVRPAPPHAG